jgi:deoxycytidine triphosphate deaminase
MGTDTPSILANAEIRSLISAGELVSSADDSCIEPCSYDMRIGAIFRDGQVIDETHARGNEQIGLAPGEVITMTTLEELALPADIAATAHAINAQSSEGLLVLNPGHVDPGYKGTLTVMAVNMRRVPYVVSRKDKIFTVVFHRLAVGAAPAYLNRKGSRNDKERDLNKKVVEKSVTSLADLIALNAPFTRPVDVDQRIRRHWMSWLTLGMASLGLVASITAAVFAVIAVLQKPSSPLVYSAEGKTYAASALVQEGGVTGQPALPQQGTPPAPPTESTRESVRVPPIAADGDQSTNGRQ